MIFNSIKEKFIFYHISTFLFSLIPLFLITGPFLSDLSVSLISILFLIYCFKKNNFSYFYNKYFYFFLIFWGYLILNSLINNFNLDSLKISFFYFRYGIFVIAIITLLNVDNKFIKSFFYCIFICFTVLIIDGFYQYFVGQNILGMKSPSSHRVSSFFGDEMILGSYLSRLWPIFFGLSILFFKKQNKLFFILILIFILSEVLIFLSGDRTAFFYINFSAIFVILLSNKLSKLRLFTLISSIILLIIISYFNPTAKQRVFDQTLDQLNLSNKVIKEENEVYIFTKAHTHNYITAYRMFLDNKVLGVGVKNFRIFCDDKKYKKSKFSCATHPHNTYLQILTETGIVGFLFLLFVLIYFCKFLLKQGIYKFKGKYYFTDFEICLLSGIAIYLWPIVPTGSIFNNWLNIVMILPLPFLFWSRTEIKN
ncbi:O-antigen ligase family protein [Candidatus Pelagibacter sp.]|nr:O-antigen ligase family protein [Candidatus Pelagibacter sp.]